jgi:tetratricopeptide (TPR) repeat protein
MPYKLTLQIDATETPPGWRAQWSRDDRPIGEPITVQDQAARAIADLSRRFLEMFEQGGRPLVDPEALRAIGRGLFATWFAPAWSAIAADGDGPGPHDLLIQSADRRVLNLPWELVELAPDLPVGCDAAWSLRRSPLKKTAAADVPLRPGPLRIAFLAAAPTDQDQLDYEREEDAMLGATARLPGVAVQFAELGSFEELADLVAECRPHVVHLSGHGRMAADGQGTFAFEDERGRTDSHTAAEIVSRIFRGSSVQCVFFNGCQTSQAAAAGLCESLVAAGVPLAVGWSAKVADDLATDFTAEFYRRLVRGEPVAAAAAHARELIRGKGRTGLLQDASFALLQVYSSAAAGAIFDSKAVPEPYAGPRTEYVILVGGIKGLRKGFVGRRREGQRLVPALRDGDTTFALITGIGGAGKSTLATRAANKLESAGFRVVAVRVAEAAGPLDAGEATLTQLIGEFDDAFIQAERDDLHRQLTDGTLPQAQRLRLAVKGLNELRLVIVIDNFEDVLELERRRIVEPNLAQLYRSLATRLMRGSRVIITCRYVPEGTPTELPTVVHLPLPDLGEPNFRKFLQRDEVVDTRIGRGELPPTLIHDLYQKLGGTPGFLENVRRVLRTADPDALIEDLEDVSRGILSVARESYYQRIIATRLYDALSPEARHMISRLAISELPLPIDGVMRITGSDESLAGSSLGAAFAFGLLQRFGEPDLPSLYHPPGLLRPWLADPDRLPEAEASLVHQHLAAFWRSSFEAGRVAELRVLNEVELRVCRSHAERGEDAATFQWATLQLALMLEGRVEWSAARMLLEQIPESELSADCLLALSSVEVSLGEWKAARVHLERAHSLLPDKTREKAFTWHNLATIDLNEGDLVSAREKFGRSLKMRQALGDRAGQAATWHQLATIDLNEGNYKSAREKFANCLLIRQRLGDRAGKATAWQNLATIDLNEGNYKSAREKFAMSLQMRQALGDRAGEAATWHQLATIDFRQGDYVSARERFGISLLMRQAIDDRAGEAAIWHQLASIDLEEGHYAAARDNLARSLKTWQTIGDRVGEAAAFYQLGVLTHRIGRVHAAARLMAFGFLIDQTIGHKDVKTIPHKLSTLCTQLGYDQSQFEAIVGEAKEAYQRDRGQTLVEQVLSDDLQPSVGKPIVTPRRRAISERLGMLWHAVNPRGRRGPGST